MSNENIANVMPRLIKGEKYYLKHNETVVTRRNQSNMVVETMERTRDAYYDYIGSKGNKLHFYDWTAGFDLFISKEELKAKYVPK